MLRSLFFLLLSTCAFAQSNQPPKNYTGEVRDDNVITAPQELRRVVPPPAEFSADQLEQVGDDLRGEKEYADSIDYYSAAIQKNPTAKLFNKRGMAKTSMMRFDDAKKDFEAALKLDRNFAEAENNIGAMLHFQHHLGGAVKHYKKAIKIDPRATFYSNLGTAYFGQKDYKKAQANYETALRLDPDIFERQQSRTATQFAAMTPEERAKYDYVIAKMYAIHGNSERCLLYLQKAMEEGYPVAKELPKDREFAAFRDDSRVKQLLASKPITVN